MKLTATDSADLRFELRPDLGKSVACVPQFLMRKKVAMGEFLSSDGDDHRFAQI